MMGFSKTDTRTARLLFALAVAGALAVAACGGKGQGQREAGRRYHLTGKVVQVDKPQQHLVIDHEEIPGFMGAMTMPYPVADARTLDELSPGDRITADVVVGGNQIRLENVVVVKKSDGKSAPPGAQLQPSEQGSVPDFALVNQDGKRIHLGQFHGKSVLLTFIYTRCPLPDYCPLMTHNFAEIDKELGNSPELYGKTHLLSISFDSDYDKPPVLRKYAKAFVTDRGARTFEHWEFTTVPSAERSEVTKFFDVFVTEEQGQITHSLSTAIISPDGRIYKSYNGNEWKPADVLADLRASAGPEPSSKITQSRSSAAGAITASKTPEQVTPCTRCRNRL